MLFLVVLNCNWAKNDMPISEFFIWIRRAFVHLHNSMDAMHILARHQTMSNSVEVDNLDHLNEH